MTAPSLPPAASPAGTGGSPLDVADAALSAVLGEGLATLLALPSALHDAVFAFAHLPSAKDTGILQTLIIACATLAGYTLVRRWTAKARLRAEQHPMPFLALLKQAGYELFALAIAAGIARVLLVRWLNIPHGAAVFPAEAIIALVRWLFAMAITRFFFQPSAPALRFVSMDNAGAARALRWSAVLIGIGHAHAVLLSGAIRTGFTKESANALTSLVALLMVAGTIRLLLHLRRHGLKPLPFGLGILTLVIVAALWIWGALSDDTNLFRGAVGTISIIVVGLIFDQVIALSIKASRRPETMRRLFVVRVVVGALALALITRILLEFWFSDAHHLFGPQGWAGFSRRLNLASIILVSGLWLCALIHVWVQARLTPAEGERVTPEAASMRARLSTILPIIRFGSIAIILLVIALMALSVLGIDITPLMAGAGILGLAISLGSQTLVKDIVSGLFYMFDDVFRLGEMIESNGRRGRLEHISTRSVRLRDDEGRVHTIPFGDLGTITNHSRRLVQMTADVRFKNDLKSERLTVLARMLVSAMRSESLLQTGIVGTIETAITAGADATAITLSFRVGAGLAPQVEQTTLRLLTSELEEAGLLTDTAEVLVSTSEISSPTEKAADPTPP